MQNWANQVSQKPRIRRPSVKIRRNRTQVAEAFDHDWTVLAKQDIGSEMLPIEIASASDPTPAGMVRLTWKDYMEMM